MPEETTQDDDQLTAELIFTELLASFERQKATGAPDDIALRNALTPVFLAVELQGFPEMLALANRLVMSAEKQGGKNPHEAGLQVLVNMGIGGLGMDAMPDALANVALALLSTAAVTAEKVHRVDARGFVMAKFAAVFGDA